MFESDQHDFDEEYAEISHPAPPLAKSSSAVATIEAPPAVAPATSTAPTAATKPVAPPRPIAEEIEESEEPTPQEAEQEEFVDAAEKSAAEPPKKKPNFVLIGGFAALIVFAIFAFMTINKPKVDAPQPGDMGPGIFAVAGLRGHLDTKWDGNAKTGRLVYQLRIEPMEDRWGAGFSRVVSNPPMPLSVNVRIMDSSGFALCGKEIDFPFNPQNAGVTIPASAELGADGKKLSAAARAAAVQAARQSQIAQMQAAEVIRERGKDLFQNQIAHDGLVGAVNAQGTLPCSPDQYRKADYWDFNTNFPTLDEQAMLLDPKAALREKELEEGHTAKRTAPKWGNGFVIQGDDRVTGYDSARGMLWVEDKTFAIDKRYGQATASDWSNRYALIHYKCDQHASCALTAAGQSAVLHARLN
ncbi:hypothetical protein P8935_06790 [Telmatobacter sp. DSM 110680]|uniref:Uncharacterized protein n=1 Tax=Telmatobacter sp. DSM 110680 TaxID=3036704 RepID=A0AAU7DNN6_9BACT